MLPDRYTVTSGEPEHLRTNRLYTRRGLLVVTLFLAAAQIRNLGTTLVPP